MPDGAEGIGHHRKPRDAERHAAMGLRVVKGHHQPFVRVFVVHVVDDVQRVHIQPGQPLPHVVKTGGHGLHFQVLAFIRG